MLDFDLGERERERELLIEKRIVYSSGKLELGCLSEVVGEGNYNCYYFI